MNGNARKRIKKDVYKLLAEENPPELAWLTEEFSTAIAARFCLLDSEHSVTAQERMLVQGLVSNYFSAAHEAEVQACLASEAR